MAVKRKKFKSWQRIEYVKILKNRDTCCVFCKTPWSVDNAPTLDHVIPVQAGGTNDITNIKLACYDCNNLRGHIPYEVFKENVTSPETRDSYREELAREGKDEEIYQQRQERNRIKKEYIEELRILYGKYDLDKEVYDLSKELRKAQYAGNGRLVNSIRAKLNLKRQELSLTTDLIQIRVKDRFCGKKFN